MSPGDCLLRWPRSPRGDRSWRPVGLAGSRLIGPVGLRQGRPGPDRPSPGAGTGAECSSLRRFDACSESLLDRPEQGRSLPAPRSRPFESARVARPEYGRGSGVHEAGRVGTLVTARRGTGLPILGHGADRPGRRPPLPRGPLVGEDGCPRVPAPHTLPRGSGVRWAAVDRHGRRLLPVSPMHETGWGLRPSLFRLWHAAHDASRNAPGAVDRGHRRGRRALPRRAGRRAYGGHRRIYRRWPDGRRDAHPAAALEWCPG